MIFIILLLLQLIPLIHSYAQRAFRFMDAYRKGLNGKQAAYACKKYSGHRTIPLAALEDLDNITV